MNMPTFMVLGAQKAGTTWLHECLQEHPAVFMPQIKELHFFSRAEDNRFSRRHLGFDWYLAQFSDAAGKVAGEATPDYMFYPYVAKELHEFNPDLKLIFMLREPVDRAYSAYWMWRRHTPDLPPFEDVITRHPEFLDRGRYFTQISRFLELFPREQIFVAIYERATAHPEEFFKSLFTFLKIDPTFVPAAASSSVGGTRILPGLRGMLLYKVVSPIINLSFILPIWRKLRRTRVRPLLWSLLGAKSTSGEAQAYEPLPTDARARLTAQFSAENQKLSALLGDDLREWTTSAG
ncbi:MAG: sulfotransferase domain-containing protein [Ferrovibrio sp.]|uniref:sulfotransferase family protein n=1 Tax=Ferrovibrio sp. TaxID=1917215 RepID=UPI00260D00C6|nr:sulfotransferase domain-containing protein [Ferrovibrio sp.]MCW0234952.1 sulfotransferase domain-containing protein [Ferrovibrio sp.]